MHIFSRPLAEAVKKARRRMNLTQEQVGALTDTNARTISAIETGRSNTRFTILFPLIRCLRINANEIFYPEMSVESTTKHQLRVLTDECSEEEAALILSTSEAILNALRAKNARTATEKNESLTPLG